MFKLQYKTQGVKVLSRFMFYKKHRGAVKRHAKNLLPWFNREDA